MKQHKSKKTNNNVIEKETKDFVESLLEKEQERLKRSITQIIREISAQQISTTQNSSSQLLGESSFAKQNSRNLSGRQIITDVFDNIIKNFL